MTDVAHVLSFDLPPSVDQLITDDGEPLESERHRLQMQLLLDSLGLAWADRDDVWIGGNTFFYFSTRQAKQNEFRGPDVMVVLATERRERKAWVTWEEEGHVPDLIIELISETTAAIDRGPKKKLYERLRVPLYFLFDPFTGVLEGYQLFDNRYRPLRLQANGRLAASLLGLELGVLMGRYMGVTAPWLRWFDATGEPLPSGEELALAALARAEQEAARAEQEAARAEQEAARAEQEAARAEQEAARAEQEAARAQQEAARAQQEAAGRLAAEQRAAAAEAELADLRARLTDPSAGPPQG